MAAAFGKVQRMRAARVNGRTVRRHALSSRRLFMCKLLYFSDGGRGLRVYISVRLRSPRGVRRRLRARRRTPLASQCARRRPPPAARHRPTAN
ncbi:hypothetical protein EVAR_20857_1 [Eumeta japonica]|uniref:Uncharacterized protein n=1 Tax=Eumeta variegata TaxID=151549 RepID=A0A4C1UEY3_EUMVA|nr:hypothetical protein EVAR_20857_1 [Eumeta japonica]